MRAWEKATATLVTAVGISTGLLVSLEGYSPTPYVDVAGVLTECYGNTLGVRPGTVKTQQECEALLNVEVGRIGSMLYKEQPKHSAETLAASISFVYNIGDGAYRGSTFRKKLLVDDFKGACYEMNRWVYITKNGSKVRSNGLVNRRVQEVELCLSGLPNG